MADTLVRYEFTEAGTYEKASGGTIMVSRGHRLTAPEGEFKGDGVRVVETVSTSSSASKSKTSK